MITDQLNNHPEELTTSLNLSANGQEDTASDEESQGDLHEAEVIPDDDDDLDDAPLTDDDDAAEGDEPAESDDLEDTDPISPDEAANEDEALENEPLDEEI